MNTALLLIGFIGIVTILAGLVFCGYLLYKTLNSKSELEDIVERMDQVDKELKQLLKEK